MIKGSRQAWLGLGGLALSLGACQLVSGLSGYQESGSTTTGGSGGATTTTGTGASTTSGEGGCASGVKCPSDTGCIDLMTDPLHCGACDAPCKDLLASCAAGKCGPAVLGGPYASVSALAANEHVVCWVSTTAPQLMQLSCRDITSVNTDPPGEIALLGWTGVGGLAVAEDGQRAFLTRNQPALNGLYQWIRGADADGPLTLLQGDPNLTSAGAVVSRSAKQTRWGGLAIASQRGVYTTENAAPYTTSISGVALEPRFASDSTYVYWSSSENAFAQAQKDGNASQTVHATYATLDYLAADGIADAMGYLYWISNATTLSRVHKKPEDAGQTTEVSAASISGATGLAVSADGAFVYWIESAGCALGSGKLVRLAWGQPPITLVNNVTCPANLALSDAYLYFSAGLPGAVEIHRVTR
ncbi:MAG: hypothetical protein ABI193_02130 [Minicystis sp.]